MGSDEPRVVISFAFEARAWIVILPGGLPEDVAWRRCISNIESRRLLQQAVRAGVRIANDVRVHDWSSKFDGIRLGEVLGRHNGAESLRWYAERGNREIGTIDEEALGAVHAILHALEARDA